VIPQAVEQFEPIEVSGLSNLKKADLAHEAEGLAAGTGWLLDIFRLAQRCRCGCCRG
jgi:ParB family chromosome partitioning protein